MSRSTPILLTRPEAGSRAFASALAAATDQPIRVVISPLLRIESRQFDRAAVDGALPVFTSAQGVESWIRNGHVASGPARCVGAATTKSAKESGFDAVQAGETVEDLFADLKAHPPGLPIVHVRGRHTRGDLVSRLNSAGIAARGVIAYDQVLCALSPDALALLDGKEKVIVPLFSPRTAHHFFEQCPEGASVTIVAMSQAVAGGAQDAIIAEAPDLVSMVRAVVSCL